MNIQLLEEVVFDQMEHLKNKDTGIVRDLDFNRLTATKQIVVITGIRRCGKSTVLLQLMQKYERYHYLNFDDERLLDFTVDDFRELMVIFNKQHESGLLFFDEIQNVDGWERFVRRIYDEGSKIFITGSNARLLSSELATHLTGRYIKVELFPFSFHEVLKHKGIDHTLAGSKNRTLIIKAFDEYLTTGGFPEFLNYRDDEFLKRIYEDILYKDLVVRFGIRNVNIFRNLARYLITNIGGELSYNSLKSILSIKSTATVKEYVAYLQESYLIFELYKFDFSLKKQFVSNKKIYACDNGLRNRISFLFSKDTGKIFENLVFLALRRKNEDLYFYKSQNNKEVDFVFRTENGFRLIQASYTLSDVLTRKREVSALIDANRKLPGCTNFILTYNEEETIKDGNIEIQVIPLWKWLILMQ
jgi:predicted AAA+ superfamily ATPase